MLVCRVLDHLLVRLLIVLPEAALLHIGHREFPVLLGIFEALEESLLLFLLGDVQEEFPDQDAVSRQIALIAINVFEALLPDFLGHKLFRNFLPFEQLGMNAHHKDFFIVRAVENPDPSALRKMLIRPPQVVVIELFFARSFEGSNLASLRIHSRHDVLDDAVFPGRIHRLKNQQHGPAVLRIELFLKMAQQFHASREHSFGVLFRFQRARVVRVEILQAEFAAVADAIRPCVPARSRATRAQGHSLSRVAKDARGQADSAAAASMPGLRSRLLRARLRAIRGILHSQPSRSPILPALPNTFSLPMPPLSRRSRTVQARWDAVRAPGRRPKKAARTVACRPDNCPRRPPRCETPTHFAWQTPGRERFARIQRKSEAGSRRRPANRRIPSWRIECVRFLRHTSMRNPLNGSRLRCDPGLAATPSNLREARANSLW